jgi:hypothetical protein
MGLQTQEQTTVAPSFASCVGASTWFVEALNAAVSVTGAIDASVSGAVN